MITSDMSQEEEQEYINESLSALTRSIGHRPVGWLGPEYGESFRTPQLLARAGVRYVCDWPNDEQPYPIKTPEGELVALPLMLELDDVAALAHRRVAVDRYAEMLKDGFDVMYQDGKQNGRVLGLNLHPWLIGQPFRIGFLDEALVLQRRFLDLVSFWAEIAPQNARAQSCQACGLIAMRMCSRVLSCEPSL